MEPKDYKIKMAEGMRKRVAEIICSEITESYKQNQKTYKRAERNENIYAQQTIWMQKNQACNEPWPNAADYFVPMTEWIVDAIYARVVGMLFSKEPYLDAVGEESNDVDKAPGVTDFVDMVFREIVKVYENTNYFWKQIIKLPFAVLKYEVVSDYDRQYVKDKSVALANPETGEIEYVLPDDPDAKASIEQFMAQGYQLVGEEEVWVREDVEVEKGPKISYVRFADYVWSPDAKRGIRLYWEGNRDWLTINQMRLKAQQGQFDEEVVKRIADMVSKSDKTGAEKDAELRQKKMECFHWYGRLPFNSDNKIDLDDPEAIEQEVYCFVDFSNQELLQALHWYHKRPPYPDKDYNASRVYIRQQYEETENFDGRSVVDKLYKTQAEMNKLHNTMINNAMIAMQKIFVKRASLQEEGWEKPMVYPGAIWEEDMPGDVRVLDVGDVKGIGFELESSLINFAERLTNISVYQTGTARQKGGKTASEVEDTIAEGNIGLDVFMQRCFNTLRVIAKWTVSYFAEDMPVGLERRIRGNGAEMVFPTEENMNLYTEQGINPVWTEDDLTGKFDFKWDSNSLNNTKKAQLFISNDLMDRFLPQPMISGNLLATWEIMRKALIARGIKDWQKILPPRDAIVSEMQRMDQEARARAAQPLPGGPGMPPGAPGIPAGLTAGGI